MAEEISRHVRLKPYNKQKGHVMRQFYSGSGHRFHANRGWYRVSLDMANELKKVRQIETDPDSPDAFDIKTKEEAYEIDLKERAPMHQALATSPLDFVGGDAADKTAPVATNDDEEEEEDDGETAGGVDDDADAAIDITGYIVKDAKPLIAETDDMKTLVRWLEEDGRVSVADAIEKRMAELEEAGAAVDEGDSNPEDGSDDGNSGDGE
jgi:hypothetical protein